MRLSYLEEVPPDGRFVACLEDGADPLRPATPRLRSPPDDAGSHTGLLTVKLPAWVRPAASRSTGAPQINGRGSQRPPRPGSGRGVTGAGPPKPATTRSCRYCWPP